MVLLTILQGKMNKNSTLKLKTIISLLLLVGLIFNTLPVNAQVSPSWAYPAKVPGLTDSGLDPIILTDSEGTIHIFNSQPANEYLSIFYTRWNYQKGWSALVDIITSPRGDARIQDCYLDEKGWIHLIFWGGDELGADMYYTKAPVISADKSTDWSDLVLIGDSAIIPPTGALAMDRDENLIALYGSNLRGNGLYAVKSLDDGKNWSSPEPIFFTYQSTLWPTALEQLTDEDGQIFATWVVADESGNGQEIYFSKLTPDDQSWTKPIILAEAIGFESDTPTIIKHLDDLIIIYHNNDPTTRWMRRSSDNGDTWSQPTRLFDHVGSNGAASLVIDNGDNLHLFFGNRVGVPAVHGAWYSQWREDQWSNPEAIISGYQVFGGPNGEEGFDPSFLQATVSRGNLLFIIWRHDPRAGPTNIWYTYQTTNAPQIPVTPLPAIIMQTPTATALPTETQIPTIVSTPDSINIDDSQPDIAPTPETKIDNPNTSIIFGLVPVAILFIVIIFLQKRGK